VRLISFGLRSLQNALTVRTSVVNVRQMNERSKGR
jgi:hypothetical protein